MRITVRSKEHLLERFGSALRTGGMFVPHQRPPAAETQLKIEFVLADGAPLATLGAVVVRSKPALSASDTTAGMALRFLTWDAAATALRNEMAAQAADSPSSSSAPRIENLGPSGEASTAQGPVVGIDLGTTFSCVAVVENGEPRVLRYQEQETFPSVVFLEADRQVVVGQRAVERMVVTPERGVYGSKRFLGRAFHSREVGTYGHFFNYDFAEGRGGRAAARVGETLVPLEVVAAYLLAYLRKVAEGNLGCPVTRAVLTVPAYFDEGQRQALREAGRMAGFTVERILSEPTAAAVAFGHGRGLNKTILVYDLGGGTFDATVLRIAGDDMEVLAADGDAFLGGCDFDDRLTEYLLMQVERIYKLNLRGDPVAVQRVRIGAELAKRELSNARHTQLEIPFLAQTATGPLHVSLPLARDLLEALTDDLATRTLTIVDTVLSRAGVAGSDLDDIVAVGGQTRSPHITALLEQRFGRSPSRKVHPDHAVAIGAALVGASLDEGVALTLADVLPASIRMTGADGATQVLLKRGERLPARVEVELETVRGKDDMEFRIELVSGEAERAEDNSPVGKIRLPSSVANAFAKTKAPVTVEVDHQGLLRITAKHPITQEIRQLEISMGDVQPSGDILEPMGPIKASTG